MTDKSSTHRFDPPPVFWLLIALAFAVVGVGFWFLFHAKIARAVLVWKHWQLQQLGRFTPYYDTLDRDIVRLWPGEVTLLQLAKLFDIVGGAVNLPAAGVLAVLAVAVYFFAPSQRFRERLDIDGVFRAQGEPFRCAGGFIGREQPLVAPREGTPRPNDFALHTGEWIERHAWSRKRGFREDLARLELARQLGPAWTGPAAAEPHARVLFAAFALHAAREREAAASYLGDLAQDLPRTETDEPLRIPAHLVAQADRILADAPLIESCVKVAARHGFQATALMGVLEHARARAGVLAPAQFNVLKLVDRRLWYALHSVGMPNPYVEARGARDHWAAERLIGEPLHTPSIDRAVLSVRAGPGDVGSSVPTTGAATH